MVAGKRQEALATMKTAFELDPKPTVDFHGELGEILFYGGQYERAIEHLEKIRYESTGYRSVLVAAYAETGQLDKARTLRDFVDADDAYDDANLRNLAFKRSIRSHYQSEDLDRLMRALAKAGVPEWPYGYQPAAETRLTNAELEKITAERTWTGQVFEGLPFVQQFLTDGRVAYRDHGSLLGGTAEIREDQLCTVFPAVMLGRESCGYVYRNVDPSADEKGDYVHVTIGNVYFFSVSPP
jgi:adenylate cyclase